MEELKKQRKWIELTSALAAIAAGITISVTFSQLIHRSSSPDTFSVRDTKLLVELDATSKQIDQQRAELLDVSKRIEALTTTHVPEDASRAIAGIRTDFDKL